jgi:hypothetical protein
MNVSVSLRSLKNKGYAVNLPRAKTSSKLVDVLVSGGSGGLVEANIGMGLCV